MFRLMLENIDGVLRWGCARWQKKHAHGDGPRISRAAMFIMSVLAWFEVVEGRVYVLLWELLSYFSWGDVGVRDGGDRVLCRQPGTSET